MAKLKLLALALSVVLVACLPSTQIVTDNYNRSFSDRQTTFYLTVEEGFVVLVYSPNRIPHEEPVLSIVGDNILYNSSECVAAEMGLDCYPGYVVDGVRVMNPEQVFTLPMSGRNIVANASYRQPNANKTYTQIADVR